MSDQDKQPCTSIVSVQLLSNKSKTRHVAETDDRRLVVLETTAASNDPNVICGPVTLPQVLEHCEMILAGSARHISHNSTPLMLAAALLSIEGELRRLKDLAEPQPTGT